MIEAHSFSLIQSIDALPGWQPEVQHQDTPGRQQDLKEPPSTEHVPTWDGSYKLYQAAGKLEGRKAVITGGDSGIGRSTAVLFAMEGADSLIAYLPEEEKDAQETKKQVEKHGRQCHLLPVDLRKKEDCKKVIDEAVQKLGGINILFNNHATQMMKDSIFDISDEQWENTFNTNIHRESSSYNLAMLIFPYMALIILHQHSSTSPRPPCHTCTAATRSSTMLPSTRTSADQTYSTTPAPRVRLCHSRAVSRTSS